MADPVTLGTIALGATAAGGAVKAGGNIFTAFGQAQADTYRSQIAAMNAVIAQQDAAYAVASGYIERQQVGYRTADEVARTKVAYAAGDISTTTGSAKQVVSSEIAIGQQNEAIVSANAAKRAYGFQVQSAEDTATSNLYKMAAANDRTTGFINAGATVLGTVGTLYSQYTGGGPKGSGIYST